MIVVSVELCRALAPQALVGAARAEPNGTVRRAYASATASVVRYAPDARVGKLVAEAVELYTEVRFRPPRRLVVVRS